MQPSTRKLSQNRKFHLNMYIKREKNEDFNHVSHNYISQTWLEIYIKQN